MVSKNVLLFFNKRGQFCGRWSIDHILKCGLLAFEESVSVISNNRFINMSDMPVISKGVDV